MATILLVLAFICFLVATFNVSTGVLSRINFVAAGLALWVLTTFVGKL